MVEIGNNSSCTALVLLDFINGIAVNSKALLQKYSVFDNVNKLIKYARNREIPIIFVKVGFSEDYAELANNSPVFRRIRDNGLLKLNSDQTDFCSEIDFRLSDDIVVVKHRFNAFYGTNLEQILKQLNVDHLIIAGISTHVAVSSTARDAHDRDYKVTIVADACAAADEITHHNALEIMHYFCDVELTDNVCKFMFEV